MIRDFAEFRLAPGGGHPLRLQGPTDDPFICQASRPFLEQHVRARVRALPNVEVIDRCDVVDLTTDATRSRVTGVRVLRRADGGAEETIDADLVVDATGRGSRTPAWLAALGYEQPRQEQLTINLMYVTRHLRLRPGALDAKVVGVGAQPDRPTGFVLFAQEDDRWILTVFGYEGHHPPRDPEGLLDVVGAVAPPDVFAAIRDAEPLDDIVAYRFPANVRRRYDTAASLPGRLPRLRRRDLQHQPGVRARHVDGRAAGGCRCGDALAGGERDLARRFFRAAAKPVNRAWQAAVGGDLALPQVKAPRPLPARVIGRYAARVLRAAERDPVVARQFLRVASLQDPSTRLFRPAIALRVLRDGVRRR